MNPIETKDTAPVIIGPQPPGNNSSPLTIESGGSVDLQGSGYYGEAAVSNSVGYGPVDLKVYGGANTIYGIDSLESFGGGAAVDFSSTATVLDDAGIRGGNYTSGFDASGGVGVSMNFGTLTIGDGSGGELHGAVHGGSGYGSGFAGGDGVDATGVVITNGENGFYGDIFGGAGEGGADGGVGISIDGGSISNGGLPPGTSISDSFIEGGTSTLGAGGTGIVLRGDAELYNFYAVAGGSTTGGTGDGGVAIDAGAFSKIYNHDSIRGADSFGGTGGDAVDLAPDSQLYNFFLIRAGGGPGGGGIGVNLEGLGASLQNDTEAKIYGGNATSANADAGDGIVVNTGATATNLGKIYGGDPTTAGHGGYGAYINGGYVTSSGGIDGGFIQGNTTNETDAVKFGAAGGTLKLEGTYWGLGGEVTGFNGNSKIVLAGYPTITEYTKGGHYFISDTEYVEGFIPVPRVIEFSGTYSAPFTIQDIGGNTVITTSTAPCYCRGTRIRTVRGEIPVEELRVRDEVITAAGSSRPVRWLGHRRLDCTSYPDPSGVWPILIRAGAFADQVPARDLLVSPGHSICVNNVLIQAANLVNGATVLQQPQDRVEYWHVELDSHDVIFAEGLPAESYLDSGNRTAFANGGKFLEARPDFSPKDCTDTCLPLIKDGDLLVKAKQTLLNRAKALEFSQTEDADLHIVADGTRIDSIALGARRRAFVVPADCAQIELCTRTFVPAQTRAASNDKRELGVCVSQLQLDGNELSLDDDAFFANQWYGLEKDASGFRWRWSRGQVSIPAGTRLIVVDIGGPGTYWKNQRVEGTKEVPATLKLVSTG